MISKLNRYLPSFRRRLFWGAEFLESEVRIVGLRLSKNGVVITHTLVGSLNEAGAFAGKHGLAFKGLTGAVSHLPYKLNRMDGIVEGKEVEYQVEEDRLRPVGLSRDDVAMQTIQRDGDKPLLLQIQNSHLTGFHESLPANLSTLEGLSISPLAWDTILPINGLVNFVAVSIEENYTQSLLYEKGKLKEAVKLHAGVTLALESPDTYLVELKKLLVYHWQSKMMGPALDAVIILEDGPGEEIKNTVERLGIKTLQAKWQLPDIPPKFKAAAAAAYSAVNAANGPLDTWALETKGGSRIENRRQWLGRAETLSRVALVLCLLLILTTGLFYGAAGALYLANRGDKAAQTAAMAKLSAVRSKKSEINSTILKLQAVLKERSRSAEELQTLAGKIPDKTWLSQWELAEQSGRHYKHTLTGYCFSEQTISAFLAAVENLRTFKSTKLKSTELIKGPDVQNITGLKANRKDLVRFTVEIEK